MAERRYAEGTTVPASKTESEIKALLKDRGADKVATFEVDGSFTLVFERAGIAYKLVLPLPDPKETRFTEYNRGSSTYLYAETEARKRFEAEANRKWRALGAVIKSKLVAVEEGISTFEREFIGDAITSSGRTVAEEFGPRIKALAGTGQLPALGLPVRGGEAK